MKEDISKKLKDHLSLHDPVTEEAHVVYVMVEVRKLLDRLPDSGTSYDLIRFYCDWTLHTDKKRNMQHIGEHIRSIYNSAKEHITSGNPMYKNDALREFYTMRKLREEMPLLFTEQEIETSLVNSDASWKEFWKLLTKVLTDQPIINPIPEVSLFVFEPAHEGALIPYLEFSNPILGANKQQLHWYRVGLGGL